MNNTIAHRGQISRRRLVAGTLSVTAALSVATAHSEECPGGSGKPSDGAQPTSWVSALALQAATYAMPIVAMYNLQDSTSVGPHAKVAPNEIWRIEDIASPEIAEQDQFTGFDSRDSRAGAAAAPGARRHELMEPLPRHQYHAQRRASLR